jgi:hypothetical protein
LADILAEGDLNRGNGQEGVNLLRLHGALDSFAFRDGLDLCRLGPDSPDPRGYLKVLQLVNEQIGYPSATIILRCLKATQTSHLGALLRNR